MPKPSPRSRPVWLTRRRVLASAIALVVFGVVTFVLAPRLALRRERVERILSDYFASRVELRTFDAAVIPWPRAEGTGLVLRYKGRTDLPPLLTADRFVIESSFLGTLMKPTRIRLVRFEALKINVPPDPTREFDISRDDDREATHQDDEEAATDAVHPAHDQPSGTPIVIDRFEAENSTLVILPDEADHEPVRFDLHRLAFEEVALDRPLSFTALLTNPKPLGLIESSGQFGPWHRDAPRLTPVSGQYAFTNVDLSTIKGIGGTLSSRGRYRGPLKRIEVSGQTETPNFYLSIAKRPLPLKTEFHAIVDGTNGETYLRPVRATLAGSPIVANGAVTKTPGRRGRTVSLDVDIDRARLEDILRLVMNTEPPPISGALALDTAFVLPPGERDVIERLRLKGTFAIHGARFPEDKVQDRVDEVSRRGQGRPGDMDVRDVASDLRGRLVLGDGVAQISNLTFRVPGAMVNLQGNYALARERLDFRGVVRLDAKVSETTTGWKSWLLKLVDPLFSRANAGTVIPIRISGSPGRPEVSVERGKILRRSVK